ncbi:glycosyltransferase [Algoriphagus confluentis]|uniref:Glycosyltransferase 2-like domain-containing protein n=1 Tax=Algoriphagus confluentis TaxID=1697556 RepID=A0ABQ6PVQ3_9BACT|nr:hypothetical protein Aconfl_43560 [Algoriphagus confluentis]
MKQLPLISIGLCTYNGAEFLREQLESLVHQSYRPLEIRVRDDQSKDDTLSIIHEFQSKYSFIHLIQNQKRLGLQKNFEAVFRDCQGQFIAPCDQDDIWHPQKLEVLYQYIGGHQIAYHDSLLIDEEGKSMDFRMSDKFRLQNWNDQEPFLLFNCISGHSMLFRKTLLSTALPMPDTGFYDHWLAFVALSMGSITFCPEPLVNYRQHQSNHTDLIGKKRSTRGLDRAIQRISRENQWLEVCARFAKAANPSTSAKKMNELAQMRASSFFCFALGWEIWKNRKLILSIPSYSRFAQVTFALRYSIGLRTKTFFYTYL